MPTPANLDNPGARVPDQALESTLTPAAWLRVADVLAAKAAELETNDPGIAQIYRSDAARILAQWRRN
jgi:hypothetical protein